MRAWLVALAILMLPSLASADRCRAHCRDVARACKLRCKANHPEGASDSRHRCLQRCELHEADCRTRCSAVGLILISVGVGVGVRLRRTH